MQTEELLNMFLQSSSSARVKRHISRQAYFYDIIQAAMLGGRSVNVVRQLLDIVEPLLEQLGQKGLALILRVIC